ncbi:MAG: hypothetical protein AAGM22_30240 [Acidobacteriota bacterium]
MMIAQFVSPIVSSKTSRVDILPAEAPRERFDRLRDEARQEVQTGNLQKALSLLEEALRVARSMGDARLEALAECNRAAVAITTGQISDHVPRLRSILMRNHGVDTSFAAAYNLAQAYELQKNHKKSLFYARIARDRALEADNSDFLAKSHTRLGLSLLGESHFDDACGHFEASLELLGAEPNSFSVSPRISLGYCLIVLGRPREGMGMLYSSLRWLRRSGERLFQSWAHLFLGYGHLELGRVRHAWLHARKALALAEAMGDDEAIKSALFVLGDVERTAGDSEAAYACFHQMQQRFFPEHPDYAELLSVVGVAQVVNLRA